MATDGPAPGSGSQGEQQTSTGRRVAHARERSYLSLLPWRNFRRVLFLIFALLAVVALKKSGGGMFRNILDSVAPPSVPSTSRSSSPSSWPSSSPSQPPRAPVPETTVHLRTGNPEGVPRPSRDGLRLAEPGSAHAPLGPPPK